MRPPPHIILDIEVVGDALRIRGEKKHESEEKKRDCHFVERSYGSFQRQLALPEDAEGDNIDAEYKKGVLTVTIPRKQGAPSSAKRIDVKAK
jgi:HSP20 family protein